MTRWWWMGNALSKEDITWQLAQMHAQGIGGVEQITMEDVYERGNVPYLSPGYFELLRHTVSEAERLGMLVSLNFGGPGWVWGGDWVPPEHRNQTLLSSAFEVQGPAQVERPLSTDATINPRDVPRSQRTIGAEDRLIAVVAGRVVDGVLDPATLQELPMSDGERSVTWDAPEGTWRVMAFWSTVPHGGNAVNHVDREAMAAYVEYLGPKYEAALGDAFGKTVVSFFGDSFEVPVHRNGIYWADSVPEAFQQRKGYDLITHLPALWWPVGEISSKVRYDVNEVLHEMGMAAFFGTFGDWCRARGVQSRVQPYGFVTDNIAGAGASDIPEMEITAGEKDAVPWFDTRIGPREYVASGAHLYGRNIVSVEAYTYLHWEPYRATLGELKIASDIYLRAGANRFVNHGFTGIPERGVVPTRGFYAAIHISPDNIWWPYYHHLSNYIARCSYLLRQRSPCADIAIYSPVASQWSRDAFDARKWTRSFDWGDLGRLLLSNGYDFNLVDDATLQTRTHFDGTALTTGEVTHQVLLLPNIESMPLESLQQVADYVKQGGTAIALERIPEASCGLADWEARDGAVAALAKELFQAPAGRADLDRRTGYKQVGVGSTYWIEYVIDRSDVLERHSSALDPFLRVLRRHIAPDMAIDLVGEGIRKNNGLCFTHRRDGDRDIYFVTNVQDTAVAMEVGFRTMGAPEQWDPYSGTVTPLHTYAVRDESTWLPLKLAPFASTIVQFDQGKTGLHAESSALDTIASVSENGAEGWTRRGGQHRVRLSTGVSLSGDAGVVPAAVGIHGPWQLTLRGEGIEDQTRSLDELISWTDLDGLKYFSGTGTYRTTVDLSEALVRDDIQLQLSLGAVGNVADVRLNGEAIGVVWMDGLTLDVTAAARAGKNTLEITVTNTLINRVAGMETFPPVPEALRERLGDTPDDRRAPAQRLKGFAPLPRSGLLGPVEIVPRKRVVLSPAA